MGRIRVCTGCWNLYGKRVDGDARVAGMHARLVAMDQEIENDTRVIELREQLRSAQSDLTSLQERMRAQGIVLK